MVHHVGFTINNPNVVSAGCHIDDPSEGSGPTPPPSFPLSMYAIFDGITAYPISVTGVAKANYNSMIGM